MALETTPTNNNNNELSIRGWLKRQQTSVAGLSRTFQTWYKFSVEFCKQRQSRGRIQSRSDSKLAFTGKYPVALVSHGRGERLSADSIAHVFTSLPSRQTPMLRYIFFYLGKFFHVKALSEFSMT